MTNADMHPVISDRRPRKCIWQNEDGSWSNRHEPQWHWSSKAHCALNFVDCEEDRWHLRHKYLIAAAIVGAVSMLVIELAVTGF